MQDLLGHGEELGFCLKYNGKTLDDVKQTRTDL